MCCGYGVMLRFLQFFFFLAPSFLNFLACVAGARLNRARVIQSGARERNQSLEEGVKTALSRACLLSRARVTRVLAELLLRRL